jgi:hypothetical protein
MRSAIGMAMLCVLCFRTDGALLSVTASASAGAGDFTLHSDFNSVSADFRILITGGTGAGVFSPDITLQGITNESMGTYALLGGVASTNWPQTIQVGDPFGPAIVSPMFSCNFSPQCDVSFTFGVPLTVEMTLTASASIMANPSLAPQFGTTVFSSAEFDGIGDFRNLDGRSVAAQDSITILPEPSGLLLVGGAFLLLFALTALKAPPRLDARA